MGVANTIDPRKLFPWNACERPNREIFAPRKYSAIQYYRYAALSHRPNVFITESSIPFAAAIVAVPMRKVWVQYCVWSTPTRDRTLQTLSANRDTVNGQPSSEMNSGLGPYPRNLGVGPWSECTINPGWLLLVKVRTALCRRIGWPLCGTGLSLIVL